MISLNSGDVIDVPIIKRNPRGQLTGNVNIRPAVIVQTYPEHGIALEMKITRSGLHGKYTRIPITRWERAGLDCESYAEINTVDPITSEMAIRPRGVLYFGDFKRIKDAFDHFYNN